MKLRKHQQEFKETIIDIIKGSKVKKIIISATPGAGKSSIPIITTELIKYRLIHRIAWVVPRSALQDQGERGFLDPFFREMFDHKYTIRSSTNENDPCRGTYGFVTTFQAVGVDKKYTALKEIRKWEYALILDEYHFLEDGEAWHKAIEPLIKSAKYLILMTGTLGRNNGSKIAFTDYKDGLPVLESTETTKVINYTRTDALKEKAILPIKFFFFDAKLEWINEKGTNIKIDSFKNVKDKKDISDALYTALHSDFAIDILKKTVSHWLEEKKVNPTAKLLVVCDGIENARKINKTLKSWNYRAEIATSHESKAAVKSIKRFKNDLDILVTIAMAYVGLDVPEISHIAALTHIRSKEWQEQMIARGVRINKRAGAYGDQSCFVFAPADKKFLALAKKIEAEQLTKLSPKPESKPYDCHEKCKNNLTIQCATCENLEHYEEWEGIELEKRGVTALSGELIGTNHFNIGHHNQIETISDKEDRIRKELNDYIKKCCKGSAENITDVNRDLKILYQKPRKDLNLIQLEKTLEYAKKNYSDMVPGTTIQKGITPYDPKNDREGVWSY